MTTRTALVHAFTLLVTVAGITASVVFPSLTALFALAVVLVGLATASRLVRRTQEPGSLNR
jgi:hypothetical protein